MTRSRDDIYDEWLVARCQRREVAAWDELVLRWNSRLWYYLRRMIDHEQDATNALQEVWLHVLRGLRSLEQGARLAPWMYTIARRTAMTHYRQDYSRRETQQAEALASESDEGADQQLHIENAELVHYGLTQLGLPEREALTLFFLEDLTIKDIACLLGIPSGTVKSRLFKARRDLRRILEKES